MKQRLKSILYTTLLITCIFAFSACGVTNEQNTPVPPQNTQSGADGSNADAQKPTEVLLWNMQFEDWYNEHFTEMVEQFNSENKDVHVTQEFINGSIWDEKMKSAQAANLAPDTYLSAYNQLAFNASKGLIRSMDNLISQEAWDDIYDNIKPMVSYKGKYYAYPAFTELQTVLFYRKDMFEQAGLDPNTPPKTWEELLEYAKKLTSDNVFGVNFPAGTDLNWALCGWEYQSANHLALSDDWKSANVTDQGFVDLANFIKRLYDATVVPAQQLANYNDPKPFIDGSLAMMFNGSWTIAAIKKDHPELVDKVGVAPAPTKDGKQNVTTSAAGGFCYVIDAKSSKTEAAAKYINWLLADDPSIPARYFKLAEYSKYAVRKSVDDYIIKNDKEAYNDIWRKVITEQVVPYAKPEGVYSSEINQYVSNAIENIVVSNTSVMEALSKASDEINNYIKINDYSNKKP